MKFCKHLHKAITLLNPEWIPFWIDYKLLKKLIKEIAEENHRETKGDLDNALIRKNPREVAFFKQVHAECDKVSSFFVKTKKELKIRFGRIHSTRQLYETSEFTESIRDRWGVLEKSAFQVHSSLLHLETFAILNYCAFSKILKKHDKVTRFTTRAAFMQNVVDKSNFGTYPDLLRMIQGCKILYDDASKHKTGTRKENSLLEDGRLLLVMLQNDVHTRDPTGHETADSSLIPSETLSLSAPSSSSSTTSTITSTKTHTAEKRIEFETNLQDLISMKRPRRISEHTTISDAASSNFQTGSEASSEDEIDLPMRPTKRLFYSKNLFPASEETSSPF